MSAPTSDPVPQTIDDLDALEQCLSAPTPGVIDTLSRLSGDILILGVAGKMGPTLARMAHRASEMAGVKRRIIGVARFSNPREKDRLESFGIETIRCDLLDDKALAGLPDCPNIVYMAGMKFGSTGNESLTWAMNTFLPGMVCRRFPSARIAAFSTGNIYGMTPVYQGGAIETDPPNPLGEYAASCLGRERLFEHFSRTLNIPLSIIRLNYACELRYGVLVDLARKVADGAPIDLSMGHLNAIWQADANAMTLQSLEQAASPPFVINIAGPELLSVRRVAEQFGHLLGKPPQFTGTEGSSAILSNAQLSHRLYGYPRVGALQLIQWIAHWTAKGGATLDKPTHFEVRDGKF